MHGRTPGRKRLATVRAMLRLRSLALVIALGASHAVAIEPGSLRFVREGNSIDVPKDELARACGPTVVQVDDPYYAGPKRFRACALEDVLARGFGAADAVAGGDVLLRAADGYTRAVSGDQLLLGGAFLAFSDADRAEGFAPIDRRQVDPAPFYLVWRGVGRNDTSAWPWPYQLAAIEIVPFERRFPHTVPEGASPGSLPRRGYALFRDECSACHAINGEGGKVGPDLNVPRNITTYRPAAQLRAFIRRPQSFRYTSMPSHEHLSADDLDALLAYLRYMATRQYDPGGPDH